MLTPKMMTERLLASKLVHGKWENLTACAIWFAIKDQHAKDVPVLMYWNQDMPNPIIRTYVLNGVPLRQALEDVARHSGVTMAVTDRGEITLSVPPRRMEAMRHAVVIEAPPLREWMPVANLEKELHSGK